MSNANWTRRSWLALCAGAALSRVSHAEEETAASPDDDAIPRPQAVPPVPAEELSDAIRRGVDFLLLEQRPNGSWGSATLTKDLNIYALIPGSHDAFKAAVTSMCLCALIETGGERADVRQAIDRGEVFLCEHLPHVRRANGDAIYNIWTHCYSIQALVRLLKRQPDDQPRREKIGGLLRQQFELLTHYEAVDGGWGYYDMRYETKQPSSSSISFVNAAVLVAFHEAQQAGFEPPAKLVQRAIAATQRQRLPDHSYLYGEYLKWKPRRGINRPGGSLGRSQACNVALRLWGDTTITEQVLTDWLDRLFTRNGWLDIGRKRPVPHESWFQVAGYFYYFGHYYAAWCIEQLPVEKRPFYGAHLARTLLVRQEKDGSWWDFPFYDYHQPYGTSFVLLTLAKLRGTAATA